MSNAKTPQLSTTEEDLRALEKKVKNLTKLYQALKKIVKRDSDLPHHNSLSDTLINGEKISDIMKLKNKLIVDLTDYIYSLKLSDNDTVHMLGISKERYELLMKGDGSSFSFTELINISYACGLQMAIQLSPPY